jgi:Zn-dependent protease with chaperone function
MDFFAHQDRARASTKRLVLFYILAVLGVLVSLNIVAGIVGTMAHASRDRPAANDVRSAVRATPSQDVASLIPVLGLTTLSTLMLIGLATLFKQLQLGGDGAKIAEMLGGRPLTGAPADLDERKLLNIVEEMSIASGVPMPRVYLMDNEAGINAFAAGTRPEAAVIGVTRGAIRQLNRDELQGVIAHEYSHILNGDMRLNLRLIAMNFGIMAIGYIGLQVLRHAPRSMSRGNKKDGAGAVAVIFSIGLAMMVIGYVGTLFGKLLQSAVSRQREYLADASAVQFTRNPSGIAGALKRIGGISGGSKLESAHAGEVSHMFFSHGVAGFLDSLFATHPPLDKRIRAIEPQFDGKMIASSQAGEPTRPGVSGFNASKVAMPPPLPKSGTRLRVQPTQIKAARSIIDAEEIEFATAMLDALPDELVAATYDPYDARALSLALMLDLANQAVRDAQIELLSTSDEPLARAMAELWPRIALAGPAARLPLLELALPALRHLSPTQLREFRHLCRSCAEMDRHVSPFELAVYKILDRELPVVPPTRSTPRYHSLKAVAEPITMVMSVLASAGGDAQADEAFAVSLSRVDIAGADRQTYDAAKLSAALDVLREASPGIQRRVVDAAAHAVAFDGFVRIEEMELMRAVCAALAVPIPPLLVRQA